ncbi:MAG: hypothetical protein DSO04_05685 [Hadesarchaea archaeon]|nr:MAG: hypothetical protein DSO04_05685 [Hadesarchaea archaeon]
MGKMEGAKNLPSFQELLGKELERGIMDPTHVMALVKLPSGIEETLETLEKLEVDLSSRSRTAMSLTELATTLRVKYGYSLDVELVAPSLFHLARGLNLYPCRAVAHYWPQPSPVVFVMEGEVALVVAPRVEG